MKILGIIPARYASTRLEGKPLLDIGGKSMIRRVYERASQAKSLKDIIVATDSELIAEECKTHNINFLMTSSLHNNGTERCGEVLQSIDSKYDVVINIQGDEPFIHSESIDILAQIFEEKKEADIATLKLRISDPSLIENPNIIKLTSDIEEKALYFSRSPIPYLRDIEKSKWAQHTHYYKHIGLYGYRSSVLLEIVRLEESPLEKLEKLEQLRWLENGYRIYLAETKFDSRSIDTIEDYHHIIQNLAHYTNE